MMKIKQSILIMLTSFMLIAGCVESKIPAKTKLQSGLAVATFAGGCFWCVESDFEKVSGVDEVISGFSGGHVANPTYKQASMGTTGHVEAVQVYYDAEVVSYEDLLQVFWRQINPTDNEGQFVDRGEHYRPVIFYTSDEQLQQAKKSKQSLQDSGRYDKPINTEIVAFKNFFPAEDNHQDYYKKSPLRYKYYRNNSGRDQYLSRVWGADLKYTLSSDRKYNKPVDAILQKKLTPLQYRVTQNEATERAFNNPYWDEKRRGIYVDIVSGEPLFSSSDKFKSGTGWPSFTQAINTMYIVEETDYLLVYPRTEIRSKYADSHLGHLFKDGPQPTGLRYCINSASLRFVPAEQLKAEGYEEYLPLFSDVPEK